MAHGLCLKKHSASLLASLVSETVLLQLESGSLVDSVAFFGVEAVVSEESLAVLTLKRRFGFCEEAAVEISGFLDAWTRQVVVSV